MGPQRADLLKKELGIYTFNDMLEHFPNRHVDKTKVNLINEITAQTEYIQVAGRLMSVAITGEKRSKRLVAELKDASGTIELVWFQGITWMQKILQAGNDYLVYGRTGFFQGMPQITHPEIEPFSREKSEGKSFLEPVYPTTEKLKARGLGGRQIAKLSFVLLEMLREKDIPENLPAKVLEQFKLLPRYTAYQQVHFPSSPELYEKALNRLKFEELFVAQIRMSLVKAQRHRYSKGIVFGKVGDLFNTFYKQYLPFELTNAQKRVIKEIRNDTAHGS